MSEPVDIIVVTYNNPEYEHETVEQVLTTTSIPYHLSIYDNYQKDENLSVVWNRTIRRSDSPYVCLLNNDTVPHPGWLEKIVEVMEENPKAGAVGPVSNRACGHQGGHKRAYHSKTVQECNMLSGFCMLIRKSAWEAVGGFDEAYHLYGEDSDFSVRLIKAGYKLFTRFDAFVYHHKAKSTPIAEARGKNITDIQHESAQRFRKKVESRMWDSDGKTKTNSA